MHRTLAGGRPAHLTIAATHDPSTTVPSNDEWRCPASIAFTGLGNFRCRECQVGLWAVGARHRAILTESYEK